MNSRKASSDLLDVEILGEGAPVVFVHGYGGSRYSFRHWAPKLALTYRVILVDLKGFGAAPKPNDNAYSPHDMARSIVDLVQRLGLVDLTLVGHSLGGGVVLLAALYLLDAGEVGRIRGIVSVAGAAYRQRLPPFAVLARRPRASRIALALVPTRWMVRRTLRTIVHDPTRVDDEQSEGYAAPLRSAGARRSLVAAARQLIPPDLDRFTSRYPELDVPVLLLWGRDDPVVPLAVARRLLADLPRARLVVLADCGHLPAEEKPEESLRILEDFLAGAGS